MDSSHHTHASIRDGAKPTPKSVILLDEGWQEIKTAGIDKIEALLEDQNESGSIDKLTFPREEAVEIYTKVFVMCHQVDPYCWSEDLYRLHGDTVERFLSFSIAPCVNEILSERLLQPQQELHHVGTGDASEDKAAADARLHKETERFLSRFLGQWQKFLFWNKFLTSFLRILDRVHAEPNNLPTISKVALRKFESTVFSRHREQLATAVLDLIRLERDGSKIKRSLVVETASIFKAMDGSYKSKDDDSEALFVMKLDTPADARPKHVDILEDQFLDATRAYYAAKRDKDWKYLDSYDYYDKTKQTINEEREKSKEYLYKVSSPESALHHVLVQELLDKAPVPPPADLQNQIHNNPSCVQYLPVVGLFASGNGGHPTTRNSTANRRPSFDVKTKESAPPLTPPGQEQQRSRSRSVPPQQKNDKSKRSSSLNRFRSSSRSRTEDKKQQQQESGSGITDPQQPPRRRFSFGKASTAPSANSFAKNQRKMRESAAKKKEQPPPQQQTQPQPQPDPSSQTRRPQQPQQSRRRSEQQNRHKSHSPTRSFRGRASNNNNNRGGRNLLGFRSNSLRRKSSGVTLSSSQTKNNAAPPPPPPPPRTLIQTMHNNNPAPATAMKPSRLEV